MSAWLSLTGALTGEQALEQLLQPAPVEAPDTELCMNMLTVESIDVIGAAATRMRIQRHLREHPQGSVTIWPPRRAGVAPRLSALLGEFSERIHFEAPDTETPAHSVLLPATEVVDSDRARLIAEWLLDECEKARISERRAAYVTAAAMELVDNAVTHAGDAPDPPVVAVASIGRERIVEVVVNDSGTGISELEDPNALLALIPGRVLDGHRGFLSTVMIKAREARVDVIVRIVAGTGRLLWTPKQHRTESGNYVPGTTVIVRIAA